MATTSRPRTMYHPKHGAKEFPSGGAARRAVELDPQWSNKKIEVKKTKCRRWWTLWLLKF